MMTMFSVAGRRGVPLSHEADDDDDDDGDDGDGDDDDVFSCWEERCTTTTAS